MNKTFLRVGEVILAISSIAAVMRVNDDEVRLYALGDHEPWTFKGDDAQRLWEWASEQQRTTELD